VRYTTYTRIKGGSTLVTSCGLRVDGKRSAEISAKEPLAANTGSGMTNEHRLYVRRAKGQFFQKGKRENEVGAGGSSGADSSSLFPPQEAKTELLGDPGHAPEKTRARDGSSELQTSRCPAKGMTWSCLSSDLRTGISFSSFSCWRNRCSSPAKNSNLN